MKNPFALVAVLALLSNSAFPQNQYVSPPVHVLDVGSPYQVNPYLLQSQEDFSKALRDAANQQFQFLMQQKEQQHQMEMLQQQQQWADESQKRQTAAQIVAQQKALQSQEKAQLEINQTLDRLAQKSRARTAAARETILFKWPREWDSQAQQAKILENIISANALLPFLRSSNTASLVTGAKQP